MHGLDKQDVKIIPPYCIDQNVGNATDAFREGEEGGNGYSLWQHRKEIADMEKKLLRRHELSDQKAAFEKGGIGNNNPPPYSTSISHGEKRRKGNRKNELV